MSLYILLENNLFMKLEPCRRILYDLREMEELHANITAKQWPKCTFPVWDSTSYLHIVTMSSNICDHLCRVETSPQADAGPQPIDVYTDTRFMKLNLKVNSTIYLSGKSLVLLQPNGET